MNSMKRTNILGSFTWVAPVLVAALALGFEPSVTDGAGATGQTRSLLIVVDGLRPDYVTPELMPHLHALGERGVFGETHSAVYPSSTRVNSASIGSGCYPRTHGLVHNRMYHPEIGRFNTTNMDALLKLDEATGGQLITTVSLGEVLEQNGLLLFATGTGGQGNTFLQNPRGTGKGIWQSSGLFIPESAREEAIAVLGELPSRRTGTPWAIDSYLHHALGETPPHVTIMWIGVTDWAGHRFGVGAPETLAAVKEVDDNIGRLVEEHEKHGLTDKVNIFVTADHGFSTATNEMSFQALIDEGLADQIIVQSNQIYLRRDDPELRDRIVELLQRHPGNGNIYTRPARPGASEGIAPGTLSIAVLQWDHERSSDILVNPAWTDDLNEFGYRGTVAFNEPTYVATHGSDSPYDLQIKLVAAGPDIKKGLRSRVPTSNVDFAATILHLHGVPPPETMDGRIMYELLEGGPDPRSIAVHEHLHRAAVTYPDGFRYEAEMEVLRVGHAFYLRGARTHRQERSGEGR
jgi:hypothetical protein